MRLAARLRGITASPTMAVMLEAQDMRSRGIDVIDLGPGQPDFPTPDSIKQAGTAAIASNFTTYTHSSGIRPLRELLANTYNNTWGTNFEYQNVIVTCGAKHAVYNVCMAVFQEDEEVLNPSPYWVTFPEVVKLTGATPVPVKTSERAGFRLTAAQVGQSTSVNTAGLIVNTPNNPTGAVIPPQEIEAIVDLARQAGIFLLFDETYQHFTYGGTKHRSLAAYKRADDEDFAIVGSFSKTYSMAGWRVGYCIGPAELIRKIGEFQSHQTGNASSISQKAALEALIAGTSGFEKMRREYEKRLEYVLGRLEEIPGVSCSHPEGGFYLFPNVQEVMRAAGCSTSTELSKRLLQQARVATVPGTAFGADGYIRLSYTTSMDNLREGLGRIQQTVSQWL